MQHKLQKATVKCCSPTLSSYGITGSAYVTEFLNILGRGGGHLFVYLTNRPNYGRHYSE